MTHKTSLEALEQADRAAGCRTVLGIYAAAHPGGLTDHELTKISGQQYNSIGRRRTDLAQAKLLADSGGTARPPGRACIVWCITSAGRRVWAANRLKTAA